jgi:hypothetical protein
VTCVRAPMQAARTGKVVMGSPRSPKVGDLHFFVVLICPSPSSVRVCGRGPDGQATLLHEPLATHVPQQPALLHEPLSRACLVMAVRDGVLLWRFCLCAMHYPG